MSVWVSPHTFLPEPGSVVAFRGITTHAFDGCSLNAFYDLTGQVWYDFNPTNEKGFPGSNELREWYDDRLAIEETKRIERKLEREKGKKHVAWAG